MTDFNSLRIALVHDWLTGMRGGEKVLEIFCELFPQADIFTLLHNKGSVSKTIESHRIYTSFINDLPFKEKKYRHYLPFFPTAIEKLNFKKYDLILSTSHCVAKGLITPPTSLHISYLHTPMRYVWDMYEEYFGDDKIGWLGRMIIPFFANYLRGWDVTSSNRVDWYLANSNHVRKRISKYYGREADVIYPPVDTTSYTAHPDNDGFDLVVSALVPYKRVDLAVRAYNRLKRKLLVVGNGPESEKLKKLAGSTIEFVDWQSAEKLGEYYANCRALLFPGEEDFGIVPVEAMANGKPIIAYGKGGALETVIGYNGSNENQSTGIFFNQQTMDELIEAIKKSNKVNWNAGFIAGHAATFDKNIFRENLNNFIQEKTNQFF